MRTRHKVFERQLIHFLALVFLLGVMWLFSLIRGFSEGTLFGVNTIIWFYWIITVTIVHQVYVWICWRLELYMKFLRRWLGDWAFAIYAFFFAVLILARPVLITFLSISNKNTLFIPTLFYWPLLLILIVPSIYLFYSLAKYFGFLRAFGIDHFEPDYRKEPIVRRGIFKYTSNGMYTFGLLLLWIPAVFFESIAGIAAALFSHLYIWVHYYCTEKPDMEHIYGK